MLTSNIAILSNVNLDLLLSLLQKKHNVFKTSGYGQWVQYSLNRNAELEAFEPKYIFLLIDGNALFEHCTDIGNVQTEIDSYFAIVNQLVANYPLSKIVVSDVHLLEKRIREKSAMAFESIVETLWEKSLYDFVNRNDKVFPFCLKRLISEFGCKNFYQDKMWYMGSIPYSMTGLKILSDEISNYIEFNSYTRKKVLICDLDNTLWGGVVGEDGCNGIVLSQSLLGAVYRDTQKRISEIAKTGVLLSVVSKNNLEDVLPVFEKNKQMILKKEDFVSIKCNWKPKFENIADLAKELNLGLDSFVFLDDNPVERAEIQSVLPDVSVIDFPKDVANLPEVMEETFKKYFYINKLSKEDLSKTQQYSQRLKRQEVLTRSSSMEDYLRSLNIKIKMSTVNSENIERTVQLINKTNQFNTNTKRFDRQDFDRYIQNAANRVYVASVSDKFGDDGLVVVILVKEEKDCAVIENFLMSCRVMGRQIENAVISALQKKYKKENYRFIRASFVATAKNKPVENLYDNLGFSLISETQIEKNYQLALAKDIDSVLEVEWLP